MATPIRSTEETLALVEGLAKLQARYHLDTLMVDGIHLSRSDHEPWPEPAAPPREGDDDEHDDHETED